MPPDKKSLLRTIALIALLAVAAVYVIWKPAAQDRIEPGNPGNQEFALESIGGNRFQTPAGLIYGPGPRGEHRIDHVLRHAQDDPGRPIHGVFDANAKNDILQIIDEAYSLSVNQPSRVKKESGGQNRTEYSIDLQRRIGYVGGAAGNRRGHPACEKIKLILEGRYVVTAYPF